LQRALDKRCTGNKCSELKTQSPKEAMACVKPQTIVEDIDGCKFTQKMSTHTSMALIMHIRDG